MPLKTPSIWFVSISQYKGNLFLNNGCLCWLVMYQTYHDPIRSIHFLWPHPSQSTHPAIGRPWVKSSWSSPTVPAAPVGFAQLRPVMGWKVMVDVTMPRSHGGFVSLWWSCQGLRIFYLSHNLNNVSQSDWQVHLQIITEPQSGWFPEERSFSLRSLLFRNPPEWSPTRCFALSSALISQVRCTSCVSTTWPGWNPRRILVEGDDWTAVDFAWGPQSINIGLVCKPWTFSSLHNCDEIGFRVCSMRATSSHSRTSCQGHIRDRMSFHEDAWPSGLIHWLCGRWSSSTEMCGHPQQKMQGGPEGIQKTLPSGHHPWLSGESIAIYESIIYIGHSAIVARAVLTERSPNRP